MQEISANIKLYYLLTHTDGEPHEKEREMGEKILWHEASSIDNFHRQIEKLRSRETDDIFDECIKELSQFSKDDQINCIAWMCLIANADGFMDKNEWNLIYSVYHKSLALDLAEITNRQKELHKLVLQHRDISKVAASVIKRPSSLSENDKKNLLNSSGAKKTTFTFLM